MTADTTLAPCPTEREQFEEWWESEGQFVRAGGGNYEKTFAYQAWQAARDQAPAPQGPAELSPEFTDTARAALLWVLGHHQGGSSPVGQPIRFALGMGQHEHLNQHQLREAKRWEALHPVNPSVYPSARPLTDAQCDAIAQALDQWGRDRDVHEYGLPVSFDEPDKEWRDVIRNAAQEAPNGSPE